MTPDDLARIDSWCGYSDQQEASCCDVHDALREAWAERDAARAGWSADYAEQDDRIGVLQAERDALLAQVASVGACAQCGGWWLDPACGPSHAIVQGAAQNPVVMIRERDEARAEAVSALEYKASWHECLAEVARADRERDEARDERDRLREDAAQAMPRFESRMSDDNDRLRRERNEYLAERDRLNALLDRIAYPALMYDARVYMLSEDAPELLDRLTPDQRALVGERPSEVADRAYAERDRLRATLLTIQGWDCLNPPQAELCADLPWLRRLVDAALAGPTPTEGDD